MRISKRLPEPSELKVISLVIGEQNCAVVVAMNDAGGRALHAWTVFIGDMEHQRLIANAQPAKSFAEMFLAERVQVGGAMTTFMEQLGDEPRRSPAAMLAETQTILTEMAILPPEDKEPTQ